MGQDRVIVLLDMDCFYVQVEQREKPELKGTPCAVVQYRTYKGGGIIAISYEARDRGVKRGMMGDDAQRVCPEVKLVRVPTQRDKAVLTKYREAGAEVINVLMQFSKKVERASIDEAFIDITDEVDARLQESVVAEMLPFTHVAGWEGSSQNVQQDQKERTKEDIRKAHLSEWLDGLDSEADRRLAVGARIAEEMRAAVLEQTKFNCSAGIAHNKMLAKLSCGLNKPRKQSVLPRRCVPVLFRGLPIGKVRGLGGKLGTAVTQGLGVVNMGDLVRYSEAELQMKFGPKAGVWLYNVCRGLEDDPVRPRQLTKSVGCSKNFLGKSCLDTVKKVKFWIGQLSEEVSERLEKEESLNNRVAKSLCVHIRQIGKPMNGVSRSCALDSYDAQTLSRTAMSLIQGLNRAGNHQAAWSPALVNLGISTTKFVEVSQPQGDSNSLKSYFTAQSTGSSRATSSSPVSPKPAPPSTSKHRLESYFRKKGHAEPAPVCKDGLDSKVITPGLTDGSDDESRNATRHSVDLMNNPGRGSTRTSAVESITENVLEEEGAISQTNSCYLKTNAKGSDQLNDKLRLGDITDERNVVVLQEKLSTEKGFFRSKVTSDHSVAGKSAVSQNLLATNASSASHTQEAGANASSIQIEDRNVLPFQSDQVAENQEGDSLEQRSRADSDYVVCDQCQQAVSAWDLPEHLDFHVAQKLQESENGFPGSSPSPSGGSNTGNDSRTGKRKSSQHGAVSKKLKQDHSNKTLLSFFGQK